MKENGLREKNYKGRVYNLALVGMLCAVAIVGRIALFALPNIQPVTAIIIIIAAYLGLHYAVGSAVVIVLVTNLYLGMGIWVLYQTLAWALVGVLAWIFFRKKKNLVLMLLFSIAAGFVYGFIVSVFSWNTFVGSAGFVPYWLSGLLYDLYHAVGNAVFIWVLKPLFEVLYNKANAQQN